MLTTRDGNAKVSGMLAIAGLAAALLASPTAAIAGACPSDKVTTMGQKPGPAAHEKVTDKVLSMIPLAKEKVGLKEHSLRLRRLVVQPGGSVAWHSHDDRPAIIYVLSGTITEYSSHCAVPIVHRSGEVSTESGGLSHWWKNHSAQPVVLLSADLLHDHNDNHM
jgi:quercetin dioxygenase-like cupin family protein